METKSELCCIKWNNYQGYINDILKANSMEDVTICTQGRKLRAHRIILSACSSFFKEIFSNIDDNNPIVILCDISYEDITSIIEFVYNGELKIVAERFPSVLKTAEILKIRGLIGVSNYLSSLNINSLSNLKEVPTFETEIITNELDNSRKEKKKSDEPSSEKSEEKLDIAELNEDKEQSHVDEEQPQEVEEQPQEVEEQPEEVEEQPQEDEEQLQENEDQPQVKNRKPRKQSNKKVNNEVVMKAALEELKRGKSLMQTAYAHKIPRSTLYFRARNLGVTNNLTRPEYSSEKVRQAFKAVAGGATLRQASELFKIPKTVLWRRVKKEDSVKVEGDLVQRRIFKRSYDASSKAEAIKALERGENFTKVAQQFNIPKATLFREKVRLVESGKLPSESLKRRAKERDGRLDSRLNEAVEACKEGRMSHATAAHAFQVPKTTIWRRMQQLGGSSCQKSETSLSKVKVSLDKIGQVVSKEVDAAVAQMQEQSSFTLVEVPVSPQSEPNSTKLKVQVSFENIGQVVSKEVDAAVAQLQEQSSFTLVEVPVSSELPVSYVDEFPEASLIILTNDEISLPENDQIIVSTESVIEDFKDPNDEDLME